MDRIAPRKRIIKYKCGEWAILLDKHAYCDKCKKLKPEERPKDCQGIVEIDLSPKY